MGMHDPMDAKIAQLLNDLIEQRLDAEQTEELADLLKSDPSVVQQYFEFLRIHQGLAEREAPVRTFSIEELQAMTAVDQHFGDRQTADLSVTRSDTAASPSAGNRPHIGLWTAALATVAAALIVAAVVIQRNDDRQPTISPPDQVATVPVTSGTVARITKKIDCDWEEHRWSVSASASITAGQQLNLSRGLLVLEFNSGAELTLNGPTTLIATSGNSARLLDGKVTARVPPRGRGFKIETHAGDFIDLGTEFGMIVSHDGAIETHVFKGQVAAEPVASGAVNRKRLMIESGAAWARSATGGKEERIDAQPSRFMRPTIPDGNGRLDPPPIERGLTLWFNAASRVQRDQRGHVSAWGDNLNQANVVAEDAWQVTADKRPEWITDAIGGRPALRFDGNKALVTEPIKLGDDQSSAVVFRIAGDAARRLIQRRSEFKHLGVQLLNLNGFPHTVIQINEDLRLEARVHLGFLQNQPDPVDVGRTLSDAPMDENPHVALYTFDTENSIARLSVDGRLMAESHDAPKVGSTSTPRYLGSHYGRHGFGFTGDIAEILVYDTALSAEESVTVSEWLAAKYEIVSPAAAESAGREN